MIERFFRAIYKPKTLQGYIIRQKIFTTIGTSIFTTIAILLLSIVITTLSPIKGTIEGKLGFPFYSHAYYLILLVIFIVQAFISVILSFVGGFFTSRTITNYLQTIEDATDAISKGYLKYKLDIKDYPELNTISIKFNNMASNMERQVERLQRLVNENKKLIDGAGQAASIEERRRIARELHDAVSQQLFAISTMMAALPRIIDKNPEEAKKYFDKVSIMANTAQQELRALIMHLRPVTLGKDNLTQGITKLLEELKQKNSNIRIEWDIENLKELQSGLEENLFRVIQECISNALRHSKAKLFTFKMMVRENRLLIFMEDNGVGFDMGDEKKSSYGIGSMTERIEELGGRIDIISYPGRGTRVEIRVPLGGN